MSLSRDIRKLKRRYNKSMRKLGIKMTESMRSGRDDAIDCYIIHEITGSWPDKYFAKKKDYIFNYGWVKQY